MNAETGNEVQVLQELQRKRSGIIKMMNAQNNQCIAFVARAAGYSSFQTDDDREANWNRAKDIIKSIVEEQECQHDPVADAVRSVVLIARAAIDALAAERKQLEQLMIELVKSVDACTWWVGVKGRSYLGLALILGEAGDLGGYENPAKLWKRMGVAVMDGVRQGGLSKGSLAEAWIAHGYCPRRRSVLWTIGDSLLKCGGKDGKYYKMYADRKAYEIERLKAEHVASGKTEKSFKPGRAHNRAKRYVEKHLLKELWCQWHGRPMAYEKKE